MPLQGLQAPVAPDAHIPEPTSLTELAIGAQERGLDKARLDLDTDRLGLDRDRLGLDTQQFGEDSRQFDQTHGLAERRFNQTSKINDATNNRAEKTMKITQAKEASRVAGEKMTKLKTSFMMAGKGSQTRRDIGIEIMELLGVASDEIDVADEVLEAKILEVIKKIQDADRTFRDDKIGKAEYQDQLLQAARNLQTEVTSKTISQHGDELDESIEGLQGKVDSRETEDRGNREKQATTNEEVLKAGIQQGVDEAAGRKGTALSAFEYAEVARRVREQLGLEMSPLDDATEVLKVLMDGVLDGSIFDEDGDFLSRDLVIRVLMDSSISRLDAEGLADTLMEEIDKQTGFRSAQIEREKQKKVRDRTLRGKAGNVVKSGRTGLLGLLGVGDAEGDKARMDRALSDK